MPVIFSNNAATTLASGINSSITSITAADGSVFPTLAGGNYFYVTFENIANTAREVVKVTARSGNTLTVVRGQDGSSGQAFSTGDRVELRLNAAALNDATFSGVYGDLSGKPTVGDGGLTTNDFTDTDHTKLDAIETGATADQTGAEIKAAYEAETNAFTDAQFTKLAGIETGATADQTGAEIKAAYEAETNAFTDAQFTKLAGMGNNANNYVLPFTDNSSQWDTSYTYSQVGHLPLGGGTVSGALVLNNTGSVKVSAGTTAQRESSPSAGMFRFNSTEGKFEGYSTEWGELGGGAADFRLNSFTGNGSTTAYTLSTSPIEDNTLVYIDGVYQNKTGYAIVDNVLTFSSAPPNSSAIEITAATVAPVAASTEFKLSQFTGNGSTTVFTLSAQSPENNTNVYIDGVYQSKTNYAVSGTTLTFSTAPPSGSAIEVMAANAVVVSVGTPDDGTVTTAKIANNAVTAAKIASVPIAVGITSVVTSSSITATVNTHVYVSAAGRTITLPASPTIGQRVLVTVGNFTNTVVGRNGSKIMSLTANMTLDKAYLSIEFIFTDATQGWVMS